MIEGQKVRLRAFEGRDLEACHAFVNDWETLSTMQRGIPFPSSMVDEGRWLDRQTSYSQGEYQFAIEDGHGSMVGRCGPIQVDWKNRVAELAIMIGTPYRGRGYATEAMSLLCSFCFEEMNMHRLKVSVLGTNLPALACYERNGFVREGILRQEIFRGGVYHDVVLMGRLRD